MVPTTEQRMAVDNFYRDANTLLYADNKPTEDAIDRVVGKINREQVDTRLYLISTYTASHSIDKKAKFSRKRLNEDEGDITYINERNRVFNKKVWPFCPFQFARPVDVRFRLRDITTSIPLRFGRALSVELLYSLIPDSYCHQLYPPKLTSPCTYVAYGVNTTIRHCSDGNRV